MHQDTHNMLLWWCRGQHSYIPYNLQRRALHLASQGGLGRASPPTLQTMIMAWHPLTKRQPPTHQNTCFLVVFVHRRMSSITTITCLQITRCTLCRQFVSQQLQQQVPNTGHTVQHLCLPNWVDLTWPVTALVSAHSKGEIILFTCFLPQQSTNYLVIMRATGRTACCIGHPKNKQSQVGTNNTPHNTRESSTKTHLQSLSPAGF